MLNRRSFLCYGGVTALSYLAKPVQAQSESHTVDVDFTTGVLKYFDSVGKIRCEFYVVLPRNTYSLPVTGRVKQIILQPEWRPIRATRDDYFRLHGEVLPERIPYGDPRNAMGEGKIIIAFDQVHIPPSVRIHGNGRREDLRKRRSRGCIRLTNEAFLQLASWIRNTQPRIHFHA